jgi:N-acetylneuraminate synthase
MTNRSGAEVGAAHHQVTAAIGGRTVGSGHPAYVIAELSGNHHGDLGRALAIVDAAAEAGVDAVKLQTYTADSLTIDSDAAPFVISGGTPWDGRRLYELYQEAATPWTWTEPLFERARSHGLDVFSTPFDDEAVALLEAFDPPAHKVASFELVDHGLLRSIAATGRCVVLSTGMATRTEINEAVAVLRDGGTTDLVLLRCTSAYPARPESMDLRTIPDMIDRWRVPVGLSDHTLGPESTIASIALGACVVEKHLTLDRGEIGPDSAFSLEPHEFASLVDAVRTAEAALGSVRYGPSADEAPSRVFRRSLFVVADVGAGEPFTADNVRAIRPGDGLAPKHLEAIFGRRAAAAVPAGTPLAWALVEDE